MSDDQKKLRVPTPERQAQMEESQRLFEEDLEASVTAVLSAQAVAMMTTILALPRETVVAANELTARTVLESYVFPEEGVTLEHFLQNLARCAQSVADYRHKMPFRQESSKQSLQEMLAELRKIAAEIVGEPPEGHILLRPMREGVDPAYGALLIRVIDVINLLKVKFWP